MRHSNCLALALLLGCGGGAPSTPTTGASPAADSPSAAAVPDEAAAPYAGPQYVLPGAPVGSLDLDVCGALTDSQDRCGPVAILSSQVPGEPCDPGVEGWSRSGNAMANFAWKTLVALAWPASPTLRGVPAPDVRPGDSGPEGRLPTVFESWRSRDELTALLAQGAVVEADWEKAAPLPQECAGNPPLPVLRGTGKVSQEVLGGLPVGAGNAYGGPIVDQNRNIVLIDTRFNRVVWDTLIARGVGRGAGASDAAPFPDARTPGGLGVGAMAVQAAWMQLDPAQPADGSMHTRQVLLFQPGAEQREATCVPATVALLGLQISHKLPDGTWAFSVFEQDAAIPDDRSVPYPFGGPGCDSATPAICAAARRGEPAALTDCCPNHDHNGPLGISDRLLGRLQPTILTRLDPVTADPSCDEAYRTALAGGPWGRLRHIGTQYVERRPEGLQSTPKTLRSPLFEPFLVRWVDGAQQATSDCIGCHVLGDDSTFVMSTFEPPQNDVTPSAPTLTPP